MLSFSPFAVRERKSNLVHRPNKESNFVGVDVALFTQRGAIVYWRIGASVSNKTFRTSNQAKAINKIRVAGGGWRLRRGEHSLALVAF